LVAPAGVATGDASDRLLHSETVSTRALVLSSLPSAASCWLVRGLSAPARVSLSSRNLAAPCPSTRTSSSRTASPVRRRANQAPGGSGPPDADETGENHASRRDPHFDDRTIDHGAAFSSASCAGYRSPLTPLSPPPSSLAWAAFPAVQTVARRSPRPVPRGPRERRAHSRSGVSSIGSRYAHPARAEARTKLRLVHRSRGAHVMRIAELR